MNYIRIKKILDFLLAFIMLIILSPLMLITALSIKLLDGGKVIFKQERPGKDGVIFSVYKFRTMAEQIHDGSKELGDFERMTAIGSILRKTSIDELPQLFNILKGEMSFIGPRPLLVRYLPYYSDEQMRRHNVKPGISGWSQVNGRNSLPWEERLKLDVWYVDNISFLLDIKIFFMTIKKVFIREGINASNQSTMTFFDEEVRSKAKGKSDVR